jgi:hypothetical protein
MFIAQLNRRSRFAQVIEVDQQVLERGIRMSVSDARVIGLEHRQTLGGGQQGKGLPALAFASSSMAVSAAR